MQTSLQNILQLPRLPVDWGLQEPELALLDMPFSHACVLCATSRASLLFCFSCGTQLQQLTQGWACSTGSCFSFFSSLLHSHSYQFHPPVPISLRHQSQPLSLTPLLYSLSHYILFSQQLRYPFYQMPSPWSPPHNMRSQTLAGMDVNLSSQFLLDPFSQNADCWEFSFHIGGLRSNFIMVI